MIVRIFDSRFQHGITNFLNGGSWNNFSLQFLLEPKYTTKNSSSAYKELISTTFEKTYRLTNNCILFQLKDVIITIARVA